MNFSSIIAIVVAGCFVTRVPADDARWFPSQAQPDQVILARVGPQPAELRSAYDMLLQSVAGLAAKAVNDGHGDALVCVESRNAEVNRWFETLRGTSPELTVEGFLEPWELVEYFRSAGIIQGYILYREDTSPGGLNEHRPGMNCSVNVATSTAGLIDGILIEERLEPEAR